MEPQKFGRYLIKEEIGRGGMATVYHAYDPRFEREVALKVLPREMLHDPHFRTRFEREAKTIAMLEHPVIVPVYDFGEEDGQPYFVMRYMTGGSLSTRMKNGPMNVGEVAHLFERLAPGLDEAHAKGIIHRDLKPGNILFDQYGEPYVSDFGIAKIASGETNVTGSAIVGTPAYMSPEQAQGEGIDGRSDIYGLGVIIFELLTGQQPYHGDTPMSVVVKHITEPVPHILDVKPELPPAVEAVIEKAMAKNRDDRFSTVKALADALSAVARGETPNLGSTDKTMLASKKTLLSKKPSKETLTASRRGAQAAGPAKPRKKTGIWIGLVGGILMLCIVAIGGLLILRKKIPSLAAPTQTIAIVQGLNTAQFVTPTSTPSVNPAGSPVAVSSITPDLNPIPSPSPTKSGPTVLGGADLIAFLSNNDIWVMGVDGGNLHQVTRDGAAKSDLQWGPNGQKLFYISGKCIESVTVPGGENTQITCFTAADYLEAFEISPDGTQVAISLNRVVYVVPFDLQAISKARVWTQLRDMKGCFTYGNLSKQPAPKTVRWSVDGKKIAFNTISVEAGRQVDQIRIFDITKCDSTNPQPLDNFPAFRFTMDAYNAHPIIPSFDWDGNTLVVLNSAFRYEFGSLYAYNTETKRGEKLDPLRTSCCYTESRFSPDGSYMFFAYQNPNDGANAITKLFYIPYGTIGTGATYVPFLLPDGLFSNSNNHLDATLRPVK